MTSSHRECKACILAQIDAEYAANLEQKIRHIDSFLKVTPEVYQNRISICETCDKLDQAICKACGCYIELRGVMKKNYCPYKKWLAVEDKGDNDNY